MMTSGKASNHGTDLYSIVSDLYPICRSITGDGLRETLRYIQSRIGGEIIEVPTGTTVFDWVIPDEWNIRSASIRDLDGNTIVDLEDSTLHVVGYSEPVSRRIAMDELRPHLHTIPDRPEAIPYKTSYFNRSWGFCLTHNTLDAMRDEEYDVEINSTLQPGALSYLEVTIPGRSEEEILVSAHSCHPSLANDNLSGIANAVCLAEHLQTITPRYSYRFLFAPGTIGAIAWLALNEAKLSKVVGGLTLANLGDSGAFNYKRSRHGNALIDQVVEHVFASGQDSFAIQDFSPYGYDERQYGSPGINLPIGCLTRSVYGTFPEYHTSDDNLDFVTPKALGQSFAKLKRIVGVLEANRTFVNRSPRG